MLMEYHHVLDIVGSPKIQKERIPVWNAVSIIKIIRETQNDWYSYLSYCIIKIN